MGARVGMNDRPTKRITANMAGPPAESTDHAEQLAAALDLALDALESLTRDSAHAMPPDLVAYMAAVLAAGRMSLSIFRSEQGGEHATH